MLIILLEHKTQECVIDALNDLSDALGIEVFQELFPVILTDRGTEFLYPEAIECDRNGEIKTKVFYCAPSLFLAKTVHRKKSWVYKTILPKGHSFDNLTQKDINLVTNHINSYSRKKFNGASPYQLSKLLLNNKLHEVMDLKNIESDDVTLKPFILNQNDIIWKY